MSLPTDGRLQPTLHSGCAAAAVRTYVYVEIYDCNVSLPFFWLFKALRQSRAVAFLINEDEAVP